MQRYENNLKSQSFIYFFTDFLKKSCKKFWQFEKKQYLCSAFRENDFSMLWNWGMV